MAAHQAHNFEAEPDRPMPQPGNESSLAATTPTGEQQPDDRYGDGGTASPDTDDGDTAAEVAALQARIAELETRWRSTQADLENLRKRNARDAQQRRISERAQVATEWLPVLDNLDFALEHAQADPRAIIEGVRAVRDQAAGVLARLGFARRWDADEIGTAFDPGRHEAVGTMASEETAPGTIVAVTRPGYGDGEHQLRPAGVVVAASPER